MIELAPVAISTSGGRGVEGTWLETIVAVASGGVKGVLLGCAHLLFVVTFLSQNMYVHVANYYFIL